MKAGASLGDAEAIPETAPVLRAGVGISTRLRVEEAVEEAVASARSLGGLGRVDAALVFATVAWGPALPELARTVSRRLACEALAGASVSGVFAGDQEVTGRPALAVLALEGTRARGFLVDGLTGRERDAAPAIDAELAGASTPGSLLVLLADSAGLDPEPLLTDLEAASQIVGLGAVEPQGAQPLVWCGERAADAAVAGLLIPSSAGRLRTGVSSACRPRSGPHRVTRVDGYWILELDGRPALDVFRAALPAALTGDLERATRSLLVALTPAGGGDRDGLATALRVRPVVGVDAGRGAFSTSTTLRCGSEILLVALDAAASRAELRSLGTQTAAGLPVSFGIYLGCRGAGQPLAGHSGTEAADLASGLPGVPLIGATGAFQLVRDPAGRASPLLTHAGVLALF